MTASEVAAETRGVFERPEASFSLDPRVIGWILADAANPLNQVARAITPGARVLDVGAGNGILPRLLQALGTSVVIDAIEPDPVARELAKPLYRECFSQGLEVFLEKTSARAGHYDFVVMADVLEHLANPEPSLKAILQILSPGGRVLLSTPNVAFASVRLALLNGHFDYTDSGILERTHLRFYTRTTLLRLFQAAGLNIAAELHCLRDPFAMEINLDDLWFAPGLLWKIDRDPLSRVYQFLFFLTPSNEDHVGPKELGSRSSGLPVRFLMKKMRMLRTRVRNSLRSLGRAL